MSGPAAYEAQPPRPAGLTPLGTKVIAWLMGLLVTVFGAWAGVVWSTGERLSSQFTAMQAQQVERIAQLQREQTKLITELQVHVIQADGAIAREIGDIKASVATLAERTTNLSRQLSSVSSGAAP